jgi:acyl carrier protein
MAGLVEITAGLVEIIRDETGLSPAAVTADMPLVGNPEIDRLSLMTIVTLAEDRFKVEIPDAEIPGLITVGFAAELIVNLSSGRCG